MARDFTPGAPVSWNQRPKGEQSRGVWKRAVVKRITTSRVVIILEEPGPDENPIKMVPAKLLDFGWGKALSPVWREKQ